MQLKLLNKSDRRSKLCVVFFRWLLGAHLVLHKDHNFESQKSSIIGKILCSAVLYSLRYPEVT